MGEPHLLSGLRGVLYPKSSPGSAYLRRPDFFPVLGGEWFPKHGVLLPQQSRPLTTVRPVRQIKPDCPEHPNVFPFPELPLGRGYFVDDLKHGMQPQIQQTQNPTLPMVPGLVGNAEMLLKPSLGEIRLSQIPGLPGAGVIQSVDEGRVGQVSKESRPPAEKSTGEIRP